MNRVLILTYYFPPAGGAPVQRVLKWTRYLPEYGWEPVVLTVADGAFSSRDDSLVEELSDDLEIRRTRSWDPFSLYARATGKRVSEAPTIGFASNRRVDWRERVARWVRANVFIPDARIGWVPFARSAGRRLLSDEGASAMLSTGPPHSVHLTARHLKNTFSIPWIADFRDPWTDSHYLSGMSESLWSRRINRLLERNVVRDADLLTTVSPTLVQLLQGKAADTPVALLHNGYDEPDFGSIMPQPADKFTITYGGNMAPEQNPETLWEVLSSLRNEDRLRYLRIRLVGLQDVSVYRSLEKAGLSDLVESRGQLPRADALSAMADSSVLLVVVNRVERASAGGVLTTKVYEYLRLGWPILAFGPEGSDLQHLLEETSRGVQLPYDDRERIRTFLLEKYERWESGTLVPAPPDRAIAKYRRSTSAAKLADHLTSLTS